MIEHEEKTEIIEIIEISENYKTGESILNI
jgi:hypothetical protein